MSDSFDDVIGHVETGCFRVVADDEPHFGLYLGWERCGSFWYGDRQVASDREQGIGDRL